MNENQKLREAFELGWKMAANWSLSDHLLADMESPAYLTERDGLLQALATTEPEPTGMPELPEPDSYEFQHEETGNTMFVDRQQVEWGFEKNNPRLQKIAGAYTTSQIRAYGEQCWKAGYKHGINSQMT